MPLAFLESPFRAFPSRGAVPALAGLCFLAGSRSTAQRRGRPEGFVVPFPGAPTSGRDVPEGTPDSEAVTTVPRNR